MAKKPKINITGNFARFKDQEERLLRLGDVTIFKEVPQTVDEWYAQCEGADIICSGIFGLDSDRAYDLKDVFISLPYVGFEFLDLEKCRERNIIVSNAPGCNKESVTEWIVGMLLMKFRGLDELARATKISREEIFAKNKSLYSKKIIVLGKGNIGTTLGTVCEALGMDVSYFTRNDDIHEVAAQADIVVNTLPANDSTEGILDRDFFFGLKKDVTFVSIARQQTYDVEAMKDAIDAGIIEMVLDDAGRAQGGKVDDPDYLALLAHPKIFVTPHIAWNAESEKRKSFDIMVDNIEAYLAGRPINVVTNI